jgi:hypothetical protein
MQAQTWIANTAVPETAVLATGTIIGTSGSYSGTTADDKSKVFDNNSSTFFDAAVGNGVWAGLDLGSPKLITCIAFWPRNGFYSRMNGGMFQVSNDASFSNPTTLYTIPTGGITQFISYFITSTSGVTARYVRYLSPNDGWGNIAEMKVYENNTTIGGGGGTIGGGGSTPAWNVAGNGGTTAGGHFLGTIDGQPLVIKTNNTERARFLTNGFMGVGVTNPSQKLEVGGTVKATGFQLPVANYDANIQYIVKADANGNMTWTPFRDLHNTWSNTWSEHVNCNGKKLVGAAGSTNGLTVNSLGMAIARGFSCDSVVTADFVFDPDYQLRPLSELEQFVKENKHLPDVPSEAEYKRRGQVDMMELQARLLQKVEELTLYVIEQHKENIVLKNRISELDQKVGLITK